MTIILSNLNRLKISFTGKCLGKFVVKWLLKLPPNLAYVATLPCETLMSAKQAINDTLQNRVAIYRVGQKNWTVFRLDNFVTVSPKKACSMSKFSQFYGEKGTKLAFQ